MPAATPKPRGKIKRYVIDLTPDEFETLGAVIAQVKARVDRLPQEIKPPQHICKDLYNIIEAIRYTRNTSE